MKRMHRRLLGLILILGAAATTRATDTLTVPPSSPGIKTFMLLQLWSSYTTHELVFDPQTQAYHPVDDRFNLWFRRAIVGFKASPYPNLQFKLLTAFDGLGKDLLAGANGSVNNGALPKIGILEAYAQWQYRPGSDAVHLVAGYIRPQIGRESLTSALAVTSMDRAFSNVYLRRHLTGSALGRTTGLHVGGQVHYPLHRWGVEYGLGLFNPAFEGPSETGREAYHPLLVARGAVYFGDPEMTSYQVYRDVNFLSERRGLTLAANAARQGATALFESGTTLSADLLFNWGPFNLDGEWSYLQRRGERGLPDDHVRRFSQTAYTGHVRASYNVHLPNGQIVEPSVSYMALRGALSEVEQADARAVGAAAGRDEGLDVGLNWYLKDRKCRLLLHYNWRRGDAGAAGDGATVNDFFSQSGVGAIRRGNWLGVGVNWKIF